MKRRLPFSIDRNAAGSLVDKVADGIRQAIFSALPEVAKAFAAAGVRHVTQFSFKQKDVRL